MTLRRCTDEAEKRRWPICFGGGPWVLGLFNYWIGFSNRRCGAYRIIDLGYFKVMWTRERLTPTATKEFPDDSPR